MTAEAAPILSILIVSYNTREMTLACLRSVVAETRVPHEILLLDNASRDGSAAAVAAEFPQVRLLAETANHGFARANNILAARARGDWLLLLNPDTVVLDGAIDRLMDFAARRPEAGIWGGRTVYADGSLNPTNCWRQMSLWSLLCQATGLAGLFPGSEILNPEAYGRWPRDSEREVEIVTGCLFLIRRSFWERLGGFDLSFVMYGEEADLCRRAVLAGARPRVTPEATIIHHLGASTNLRSDRQVLVLKAKVTLVERHFPAWQKPLARLLIRLLPRSRALTAGLAARVTGRAELAARARAWAEVWARRAEWRSGYPALPHPAPLPAPA